MSNQREKFEAWMVVINNGHLLYKRGNAFDDAEDYVSAGTQHRWKAWQAREPEIALLKAELAAEKEKVLAAQLTIEKMRESLINFNRIVDMTHQLDELRNLDMLFGQNGMASAGGCLQLVPHHLELKKGD